MPRWSAFTLVLAVAVWSELPAQIQDFPSNYSKPIGRVAQFEFAANELQTLGAVSGTWVKSDGTFNSTSATTAIATIDSYIAEYDDDPELLEINVEKFWYRARLLNQRSGSSTRVGIVYHYQDPGNFYEVSFSPTGAVFVREVNNGVATTVATGTYSGGGQNKWFDAEVGWTAAETIVRVNGLPVVRGIKQDQRTHGRIGLITRQTTARFDRLLATLEYGDPEFRESFSAGAPSWEVIKGNWSVVNGAYRSSTVQHGNIALLPIFVGLDGSPQTQTFTINARMLNPYGGSGNRMGFVYAYNSHDSSYDEIVFGADGIARVNHVRTWVESDGTPVAIVTPRESAPYPWTRNQWFDVTFSGVASIDGHNTVDVSVNGTAIFSFVQGSGLRGSIGLVTNFTPGRFDDVWFSHHGPFSLTETFEGTDNSQQWSALRGTWDREGAVLNNRTAGVSDLVYTTWLLPSARTSDYNVSARMLNPYGGSGNRIGLIFNFDLNLDGRDYYEVVFAPTGQAYLNKFIQGQLTQVATATHSALGRNVWFNVELARRGPNTTVRVNNQVVFENVPTAQLDNMSQGGRIGVISHWAPGRFDDVRMERLAPPR